MKQYVVCKDEAERAALLAEIDKLGYTWNNGIRTIKFPASLFTIEYKSGNVGICQGDSTYKQTIIPCFLLSLQIAKLKAARRALPKLGEES